MGRKIAGSMLATLMRSRLHSSMFSAIPIRITVGRGAADGIIEYKMRRDTDRTELPVDEGIAKAIETVNAEKDGRCYFK